MRVALDLLAMLTHPLLLPVWGAGLLMLAAPQVYAYSEKDRLIVIALALNLTLLPIFLLTTFFITGLLKMNARNKTTRAVGYALTLTVYVATGILMRNFYPNSVLLNAIATGCVLLLLLGGLLWWRIISAHVAGWWALGMWLAWVYPELSSSAVNFHLVGACFLIGGVAGSVRLAKSEHSLTEVVAGMAAGLVTPLLSSLLN